MKYSVYDSEYCVLAVPLKKVSFQHNFLAVCMIVRISIRTVFLSKIDVSNKKFLPQPQFSLLNIGILERLQHVAPLIRSKSVPSQTLLL